MPDFPQICRSPYPAATEILAGRAVTSDGTNTLLISDTNQATTQQVFVLGVTINDTAALGYPAIGTIGDEVPFVASGAVSRGDLLVAKYSATAALSSCLMTVTSHAVGDQVVGICTTPAVDGGGGKCRLIGHQLKFA